MNRRRFLAKLSAAAAAGMLPPAAFASPLSRSGSLSFLLRERQYPLLFVGEGIETTEPIRTVSTFNPWFGSGRCVVNPAMPKVRRKRLEFPLPGEYYLYVNGTPLKALIFPRRESITDAVLRLFDFAVANSIYFGAHDEVWYSGRRKYLRASFFSDQPIILSCGPTHQMFRMLIGERLGLPTRITSANGAIYQGGTVGRIAHNIPEVFIPELGKFVACDVNSGYIPKWMDGLDLAVGTRNWGPDEHSTEKIEDLGVPIHNLVDTSPASPDAFQLLASLHGDGSSIRASRKLVVGSITSSSRANTARAFYNGTGYWGKLAEWAQPTGTAFLEGNYQFVLLENDDRLKAILVKELTSGKAEIVGLDDMRERLACGAREDIERCEWDTRFVADDERWKPLPPLRIELF